MEHSAQKEKDPHKMELRNLYSTLIVLWGYVVLMREMRNAYEILIDKFHEKRILVIPSYRPY
jgi:hypothetical protein